MYLQAGGWAYYVPNKIVLISYLFTSMTIVVTTAAKNTNAPNTPSAIIAPIFETKIKSYISKLVQYREPKRPKPF